MGRANESKTFNRMNISRQEVNEILTEIKALEKIKTLAGQFITAVRIENKEREENEDGPSENAIWYRMQAEDHLAEAIKKLE